MTRWTIQGVKKQHLKNIAEQVLIEISPHLDVDLEPEETEENDDEEILEFLINEGLRPSAAEDLTTAFRRIRLLAKYYYSNCNWEDIREHETRTFLIIPLLLALGWAEQQLKIELTTKNRKRADIACFNKPYYRINSKQTNDDDCVLIIESKGFHQGLDYAPEQAIDYAKHFPNCHVAVVSNGYCYKTYTREKNGNFSTNPSAYLNLLKPKKRYPLDPKNVAGSLDVLRILLPNY